MGFTTTAALVHELIEARDERRLLNLQRRLARLKLLIIDELGFVPLSKTGAELLFEVFSQRYERGGSVLVTSNLPFVEWTEVFGSEQLTGALLDRLTHHVDILEMNGDSYRLKHSKKTSGRQLSWVTEPDLQRPTNLDAHSTDRFSGTVLLRPAGTFSHSRALTFRSPVQHYTCNGVLFRRGGGCPLRTCGGLEGQASFWEPALKTPTGGNKNLRRSRKWREFFSF